MYYFTFIIDYLISVKANFLIGIDYIVKTVHANICKWLIKSREQHPVLTSSANDLPTCICVCAVISVESDPFWPRGLEPARFLCPWDFPGKNSGVGCCALLQGIFLTQDSNSHLLPCRRILYPLGHLGSLTCLHVVQKQKRFSNWPLNGQFS